MKNQEKLGIYWDLSIMIDIQRDVKQQKYVNLIDKCWLMCFFSAILKGGPPKGHDPAHEVHFFNPLNSVVHNPRSGAFMEDMTIVNGLYKPTNTTGGCLTLYAVEYILGIIIANPCAGY